MGQSVLKWTGHQDYLCEGCFLCDTLCRWSSRPKQQGGSPFPLCQGPESLIHSDKQHSLVHLTSAQVRPPPDNRGQAQGQWVEGRG